ncbi:hypothetical protein ASD54_21620 [Rhizobium sp. Root149]|uniref:HPP family protein n=1 Tax=Rhizobium sp. Root149 TaxID=1736473 RepID=UPI0007133E10|nr:HPP family protein [Rhizobium sp. Root149]KQZ46621.1 hypothetical protein ASD54_21620 [Rhizobium sp. Root149]
MTLFYPPKAPRRRRNRIFQPILLGATLRDRLLGCFGALAAIALTGMISAFLFNGSSQLPLLVAPMGASAVLLFAVPASPLAQPWPIIGGNTISAAVGLLAAMLIKDPVLATGVGVSLAIAAMSFTRSLHPPGGAAALTAVLGGSAVTGWGLLFPFVPVALNSCLLVVFGLLFHKLSSHTYPHVAAPAGNVHQTRDLPSDQRLGFGEADIDAALDKMNEAFDIGRDDLGRLLRQVELEAVVRSHEEVRCADIMSKDVISIRAERSAKQAQWLLLKHNIRTLPVVDANGRLAGTVGLREIATRTGPLSAMASKAITASPEDPALGLASSLTDGWHHAVIVVDDHDRILGLVSQTDLLSAAMKHLSVRHAENGKAA